MVLMTKHIHLECCWTDQPIHSLKHDFMMLANTVFGSFVTDNYYKAKFVDNIYGPSLITVAYVDGVAAGADAMWRNDLDSTKAYQTVDTCVLEQFRGMGLFKRMTYQELELLGKETLVYGYPNVNSYPGYVKMGWQVDHLYKTLFFNTKKETIDSGYAAWWLKAQNGISYINKKGDYYLVRKHESKPVATLIGRVDEATARLFPKTEGWSLLRSFEAKSSIYNKNKSIPLVCNQKWKIPYWKIDAI